MFSFSSTRRFERSQVQDFVDQKYELYFFQCPHCFRRYGKLHEVVFKWVTTEGAASSRTWIGSSTTQHFRKQGAMRDLFGMDLFSHRSSHPKMMPSFHVILLSDRMSTGDVAEESTATSSKGAAAPSSPARSSHSKIPKGFRQSFT